MQLPCRYPYPYPYPYLYMHLNLCLYQAERLGYLKHVGTIVSLDSHLLNLEDVGSLDCSVGGCLVCMSVPIYIDG